MNKFSIPDHVTMGEIKELQSLANKTKTIRDWKICLKKYATKHGLSDQQVIAMARFNFGKMEKEK